MIFITPNRCLFALFFFNDTATTEICTLSLHDALPISHVAGPRGGRARSGVGGGRVLDRALVAERTRRRARHPQVLRVDPRSEEHTTELQSPLHLACRLLLEKQNRDETAHNHKYEQRGS